MLPNEFYNSLSITLKDRYRNLVQLTKGEGNKGGHFAAFELPELVANDMISLFKQIENGSSKQSI